MVLIENLGDDLGEEFVVINISRDVRFYDEIVEKASQRDNFKIKAWGKAISLAVRLALQTIEEQITDFSIGEVSIGTEKDVELKRRKGHRGNRKDDADSQDRIKRALSWIEIEVSK